MLRVRAPAALANTWRVAGRFVHRYVGDHEPTRRNQLLATVYQKWHQASSEERRMEIAGSGDCFNDYWTPFASRAHHHAAVTSRLPEQHSTRPYEIDRDLMVKLTARSCQLEGSAMTTEDVGIVGSSVSETDFSATQLASGKLPPAPEALVAHLHHNTAVEVNEAYFHMLALCLGQALLVKRDTFYFTESEFLRLHEVLISPFLEKTPGSYRKEPIQVKGWDLACFPYPRELPALMKRYFKWLETPPEGTQVHPYLRGCDIFLVTAHLHPFNDGNGRMARLMSSLAMAHGGCRPTVLGQLQRPVYQRAVYEAQHCGKVVDFYEKCLRDREM
jgi:Fic family protein